MENHLPGAGGHTRRVGVGHWDRERVPHDPLKEGCAAELNPVEVLRRRQAATLRTEGNWQPSATRARPILPAVLGVITMKETKQHTAQYAADTGSRRVRCFAS